MFYSKLSIEITIVNKESFKKFLDPDRDPNPETLDPHCDPNLIDCSLKHAPPFKNVIKNPLKIHRSGS